MARVMKPPAAAAKAISINQSSPPRAYSLNERSIGDTRGRTTWSATTQTTAVPSSARLKWPTGRIGQSLTTGAAGDKLAGLSTASACCWSTSEPGWGASEAPRRLADPLARPASSALGRSAPLRESEQPPTPTRDTERLRSIATSAPPNEQTELRQRRDTRRALTACCARVV